VWQSLKFLASAPRGFADLLVRELGACGAVQLRGARAAGVHGTWRAPIEPAVVGIANRVYLELAHFQARDADGFTAAVRRIDWAAHSDPEYAGRAISAGGTPDYSHSLRALKAQDGIGCAALRHRRAARRASIARVCGCTRMPATTDISVSIDLSG